MAGKEKDVPVGVAERRELIKTLRLIDSTDPVNHSCRDLCIAVLNGSVSFEEGKEIRANLRSVITRDISRMEAARMMGLTKEQIALTFGKLTLTEGK